MLKMRVGRKHKYKMIVSSIDVCICIVSGMTAIAHSDRRFCFSVEVCNAYSASASEQQIKGPFPIAQQEILQLAPFLATVAVFSRSTLRFTRQIILKQSKIIERKCGFEAAEALIRLCRAPRCPLTEFLYTA